MTMEVNVSEYEFLQDFGCVWQITNHRFFIERSITSPAPTRASARAFDLAMTSSFALTRAWPKWATPRAGYFGKFPEIQCENMAAMSMSADVSSRKFMIRIDLGDGRRLSVLVRSIGKAAWVQQGEFEEKYFQFRSKVGKIIYHSYSFHFLLYLPTTRQQKKGQCLNAWNLQKYEF